MKWNLEELAELIVTKYGAKQKAEIKPLLNSVGRKFEIARYHSFESKVLIDKHFGSDKLDNYNKAISFIFDRINGDDEALKFYHDAFVSEANIVAYSQAMHSIYDIIGQIIIKSLNISNLFKNKKNIYLYTVENVLRDNGLANSITIQIEYARNCKCYKYLNAFVNTNKHLCLLAMPHTVLMDANEETPHGIRINSFNYKKEPFKQKWANNFVIEDFKELSEGIVRIGNSVNDFLRL